MDSIEAPSPTELDLLRQAKAGDYAAFQTLALRLEPRIYGLALRILGRVQDAEDVTQQTFLSLIEHLDSFREESSVATWVLKIASNHALKILRKKRGLDVVSMSTPTPEDSYANMPHPQFIAPWSRTPDEIVEQAEMQAEIHRALAELDDKYRLVFVLRDIEGLSVRDTAETLGLTESTVKVRLLRARLALRERLTKRFGDASQRLFPDHSH